MMNRRDFLNRTVLSASAIPTFALLSGCGGSSDDTVADSPTTEVAGLVSALQSDKITSDELHSNSSNNIAVSSTTSKAAARILQASSLSSQANYFVGKQPESSYLNANTSVWEQYATYNNLSYQQFTHQHTKLTASLRLYDFKKSQVQSEIAEQALASARVQLAPHLASTLDLLAPLVSALTQNLTESSLDNITSLLNVLQKKLAGLDDTQSTLYALATYISLDKLLDAMLYN